MLGRGVRCECPAGTIFEQSDGDPALEAAQQAALKATAQAPAEGGVGRPAGIGVVRQFVKERFGRSLVTAPALATCTARAYRRAAKHAVQKAEAEQRSAFVTVYAAQRTEAQQIGATIFFVDEAHFRADVELRAR